ncbi:hypothetical protein E2553_35295 [Paraburkholderia dipogonis]|uniref:Leucine-rich repeat domain-containing protein n=1 Tax=Paraburkholderia dipogonis TaxID=1211383 RepID=A0A4Y8MWZ9_9BURK|nr:leucine-rich repeat domain-containing protein [Paraburkholderia dipogonis]TFE41905.1 hypothetical protein E2553_35295 [Paraburkholderia dipogonis]
MDALKSASQLWRKLQSDAGLEIRRKGGEPGRDADVEDTIKSELDGAIGSSRLDEWLADDAASKAPRVSVERLLVAVLNSQRGYAAMMKDMLELLIQANANRDGQTLDLQFQFDRVNDPIRFTLEAFRAAVRRTERLLISHYELPSANDLWALAKELRTLADSSLLPQDGFPPVEFAPTTGHAELDRALKTIIELVADFQTWCSSFGDSRRAALDSAKQQYPQTTNPEHVAAIRRVGAAHDYWDLQVADLVREIAHKVQTQSMEAEHAETRLRPLLATLEHKDRWVDQTYTELLDLLKLPTWRKRHELFSVWVGSILLRTAKAEADRFRFLSADGALSFAFGGNRLATYDRDGEQFDIWAELRSALVGASSKRTKGIQPDFRVLSPSLTGSHNAQTRFVLECKHYLVPSVSNFSLAAADYARSCPTASVLLVNHGPIDDSKLREATDPSLLQRVQFVGNATAIEERSSGRVRDAVRSAMFPHRHTSRSQDQIPDTTPQDPGLGLQSPSEASASIIEKAVRSELRLEFGRLRTDDFDRVEKLDLAGQPSLTELTALKWLTHLAELDLSGCISLRDITVIQKLQRLRALRLGYCPQISSLASIESLPDLTELSLEACARVSDIGPLWNLRKLGYLNLDGCASIFDVEDLARLDELNTLILANCQNIKDIRPLGQLRNLSDLYLNNTMIKDVSPLARLIRLEKLELQGCANIESIEPLHHLYDLTYLGLKDCSALVDLSGIHALSKLPRFLDLSGCRSLYDLRPVADFSRLAELKLSDCIGLRDLSPLSGHERLSTLVLDGCTGLSDLSPLEKLEGLKVLNLDRCPSISDLASIARINGLEDLSLRDCSGITDLSPLAELRSLRIIDIDGSVGVTAIPSALTGREYPRIFGLTTE